MDKNDIKNILNYYLEYEIYNIANSSKITKDNKNIRIIHNMQKKANLVSQVNVLKENKIDEKIDKFLGKKVNEKEKLKASIKDELEKLKENQTEKSQTSFNVTNMIKEKLKYEIDEKVLKSFSDELCDIIISQEFWLYAHNISNIMTKTKKSPLFILKCSIQNEKINVLESSINTETLNTILSIYLNKEISEVALEYEDKITSYSKEIENLIDAGTIEEILDLYYLKLLDYVGISKENVEKISQINPKYFFNKEYIISIDEIAEEGIKNIKEDIELLIKLIDENGYIPNLLYKYIKGNLKKNNIKDDKYSNVYRGNYKSSFGVGNSQYKVVNAIKNNDLVAVEGPPGTGKTSLLKEIIANKIVERANLILKNWDNKWQKETFFGTKYYNIDWFNDNENITKSIVVSSKNGESIENVGREINQEIKYFFPVARKYVRTENISGIKRKAIQNYKGIVCLPMGKQDNVQDFKTFLHNKFIPMMERIRNKNKLDLIEDKVKENYISKLKEISKCEEIINSIKGAINEKKFFYDINISDDKQYKNENILKIKELFNKDIQTKKDLLDNYKIKEKEVIKQKEDLEKILKDINKNVRKINRSIEESKSNISKGLTNVQILENKKINYEKISKNIFTKVLNLKEYNKDKKIDFVSKINDIKTENKIEEEKISQYIKDKIALEKNQDKINDKFTKINIKLEKLQKDYKALFIEYCIMQEIQKFNEIDKKSYWEYDNILDFYGRSILNDLNQELFELALDLNEVYIAKHSKEIIENLELFLSNDEVSYICQKFYDSSEIYSDEKQDGIKSLWNTMFLCFPVITTTLDSFSKRCFHLIPEYIDLELIDEAGQILPHNFVSAAYRAKKAIIVGDVNQIDPIYNNVNNEFKKFKQIISDSFDDIKIENNSIQALANKHTDILDDSYNVILNDHYRCERNIINFSNENIYQNKLNMHKEDDKNKPFSNNMIALDVRGKRVDDENCNMVEVESCIETIKYILENNKDEKPTIAVITPFRKQKEEIEAHLRKEKLDDIVKVGTVHAFQGQERDYIIFSPIVDSLDRRWDVNFIGKKCNMLNVAVTRAKKQFIYLGNISVAMQADNYMTKLVEYIRKNGLIYSLYDLDISNTFDNIDENILKILQPELDIKDDLIGYYINKNIKNGIITDAKGHYNFLKYAIKNVNSELYIMSPWIRENVLDDEILNNLQSLKEKNCNIKIVFGYKKGNKNISNAQELADEMQKTNSLGFASKEEVKKIAERLYNIIGKENFIYNPPTHAKLLIIDNKYMCIGSHNWLSNAGKSDEQIKAKEATKITTNIYSINYVKDKYFNI